MRTDVQAGGGRKRSGKDTLQSVANGAGEFDAQCLIKSWTPVSCSPLEHNRDASPSCGIGGNSQLFK